MAKDNSKNSLAADSAEPENQYPIETGDETTGEPNWPMLAALAVAALAFAVIVVLAGRLAYHHWHHQAKQPVAATKNQPKLTFDNNQAQSASGANQSGGGKSTGTTSNPAGNNSLPNSGPGNVIAIFAGSIILGGTLHYRLTTRRSSE